MRATVHYRLEETERLADFGGVADIRLEANGTLRIIAGGMSQRETAYAPGVWLHVETYPDLPVDDGQA